MYHTRTFQTLYRMTCTRYELCDFYGPSHSLDSHSDQASGMVLLVPHPLSGSSPVVSAAARFAETGARSIPRWLFFSLQQMLHEDRNPYINLIK